MDTIDFGRIWAGHNYASPWDLLYRTTTDKQPGYIFTNGRFEDDVSPYRIEVIAYVGLAYYDGVNDGTYNDAFTGNSFPLSIATHPNLWDGTKEVGNLVRIPVVLTFNPYDSELFESTIDHLPVSNSTTTNIPSPPKNPLYPQVFDFAGSVTSDEEELLKQYGKVFFYEVTVTDIPSASVVGTYLMHPYIETVQTGFINQQPGGYHWEKVTDFNNPSIHLTGTAPDGTGYLLYYYHNPIPNNGQGTMFNTGGIKMGYNNVCDSREVVFQIPQNIHEYILPNGQYLKMGIQQNSQWLWLNSALVLSITK